MIIPKALEGRTFCARRLNGVLRPNAESVALAAVSTTGRVVPRRVTISRRSGQRRAGLRSRARELVPSHRVVRLGEFYATRLVVVPGVRK